MHAARAYTAHAIDTRTLSLAGGGRRVPSRISMPSRRRPYCLPHAPCARLPRFSTVPDGLVRSYTSCCSRRVASRAPSRISMPSRRLPYCLPHAPCARSPRFSAVPDVFVRLCTSCCSSRRTASRSPSRTTVPSRCRPYCSPHTPCARSPRFSAVPGELVRSYTPLHPRRITFLSTSHVTSVIVHSTATAPLVICITISRIGAALLHFACRITCIVAQTISTAHDASAAAGRMSGLCCSQLPITAPTISTSMPSLHAVQASRAVFPASSSFDFAHLSAFAPCPASSAAHHHAVRSALCRSPSVSASVVRLLNRLRARFAHRPLRPPLGPVLAPWAARTSRASTHGQAPLVGHGRRGRLTSVPLPLLLAISSSTALNPLLNLRTVVSESAALETSHIFIPQRDTRTCVLPRFGASTRAFLGAPPSPSPLSLLCVRGA